MAVAQSSEIAMMYKFVRPKRLKLLILLENKITIKILYCNNITTTYSEI